VKAPGGEHVCISGWVLQELRVLLLGRRLTREGKNDDLLVGPFLGGGEVDGDTAGLDVL
jgi:hypothetical protein